MLKNIFTFSVAFIFSLQGFATDLVAPTPPTYTSCSALTGNDYGTCKQTLDSQYQRDLATYNSALAAQKAAQTTNSSALSAAQSAQNTNNASKQKYDITQIVTMVGSIAAAAKFASTCPACQYPWLAVSVVLAGYSMLSGKQSAANAAVQYSACTTANQVSTTQADCGSAPSTYNPTTYPSTGTDSGYTATNLIDSNGNCTASQDLCSQISSSLPPGTSLKDYQKGLSAFASGKLPIKINPDGTITNTKDGKTFDPSKLTSQDSLVAAGMSPEMAKATLDSLNKSGALGNGAVAGSASGDGSLANNLGSFDDPGAGGAAKGSAIGANGDANASNLDGSTDKAKRDLASTAEGLVKDFNGEMIGVQGDNIFKMMNRRYLLKSKQDTFISTASPN